MIFLIVFFFVGVLERCSIELISIWIDRGVRALEVLIEGAAAATHDPRDGSANVRGHIFVRKVLTYATGCAQDYGWCC